MGSAQIAGCKLLMALPLVGAITPQYCAKLADMLHVMDRANGQAQRHRAAELLTTKR